jgi:hypothetical protein
MEKTPRREFNLPELIASALCLGLVYAVLLTRFDLRLLFSDRILTGGDSASWYQVLSTLKNDFLPHGRVFGFSQSNFFGYLEGQHYFVLPFLSAALLGTFFPLTVALKIATFAGGFALPATMFAAAYSITGRPRAGATAAGFSLLFLFNESYTIFGGNWLSTFAGEFCFSWAIALLPLLFASVIADRRKGRKGILSGILLGLIGLCHFFVFMPAFFLPFLSAFGTIPELLARSKKSGRAAKSRKASASKENSRGSIDGAAITWRILSTYLLAFSVMGFWLLPMAATRTWAQPISMIWHFSSLKDFAVQTLAWVWGPLSFIFLAAALSKKLKPTDREAAATALYGLAACAFLFFAAPGLGMPDIRFVPTALLLCALGSSVLLEALLSLTERPKEGVTNRAVRRNLYDALILPGAIFVIVAACGAGAAFMARNAPGWFAWNYSGYEAKKEWPALRALGEKYRGVDDDGRFLWEKQDQRDNADFGSERGFENLYLFTGHPTSEGINYGSSMMARTATYLQSSYSLNPVDPEPERIYSTIDDASWSSRFSLLNAEYIVTHSPEITSRFALNPRFAPDFKAAKFTVFRYLDFARRYVMVLPAKALSVVRPGEGGFKADYYRFFREYELYERPFVSSAFADRALLDVAKSGSGVWKNYDEYRNIALAVAAVASARGSSKGTEAKASNPSPEISDEHVDNFSIAFDTNSPGQPHYIKISYAPGWKSRNGEKIYPVSPGFMLVVPKTRHVELYYGRTGWEIAGLLMSLLTFPLAFCAARIRPGKRFPWKPLIGLAFAVFFIMAIFLVLQTSAGYPALAESVETARRLNLSDSSQRQKALRLVDRWATTANLERFDNMLVFDAFKIKALAFAREGKTSQAEALFETLREHYPHTRGLAGLPPPR